jgi:hypothetical protein
MTSATRWSASRTACTGSSTEVADDVSVAEVWAEIERVVPRGQLAAALAAVLELAPPHDEEAD